MREREREREREEREKREKREKRENGIKGFPKVIHVVGQEWLQSMDSWKNLNPEYAVEFFDDERCLAFIQEHSLNLNLPTCT